MSMNDVEHALQHFVKNLDDFIEVIQVQHKRVMHNLEEADGLFDEALQAQLKDIVADLDKYYSGIAHLVAPAISEGLTTRLRILRSYLYE